MAATLAREAATAPNPVPKSPQPGPSPEPAHPTLPGLAAATTACSHARSGGVRKNLEVGRFLARN
jgi:hypothetical protein